jgi:hypothetical protein
MVQLMPLPLIAVKDPSSIGRNDDVELETKSVVGCRFDSSAYVTIARASGCSEPLSALNKHAEQTQVIFGTFSSGLYATN